MIINFLLYYIYSYQQIIDRIHIFIDLPVIPIASILYTLNIILFIISQLPVNYHWIGIDFKFYRFINNLRHLNTTEK